MTTIASGSLAKEPTLADMTSEIDLRVCSLHRIAEELHERVEKTRQIGPIAVDKIEERANYISTMRYLSDELAKLLATVAKNGQDAEWMQQIEMKAAQEGIDRAAQRAEAIARSGASNTSRIWAPPGSIATASWTLHPLPTAPYYVVNQSQFGSRRLSQPTRQQVRLLRDFKVEATIVPNTITGSEDILAAVTAGELHYIPQWNHFAFRVGPCVFHANIGQIHCGPPPKGAGPIEYHRPTRIKDCKNAQCPRTTCNYYHDPAKYKGSLEIRNYMFDSWLYAPTAAGARCGSRRFGSGQYMEADLRVIGKDDARRFLSQTAHDVLCCIILSQKFTSLAH